MIDTTWIQLNGFSVRPDHGLTIQPASFTPSTGEMHGDFELWRGQSGKCAYHNEPGKYQFDISHTFGKTRAKIQLSFPRYGRVDNFQPLTKGEVRDVVKSLQRDMNEIGVACNVEDGLLSRVDAFRNLRTSEKFDTYMPILSMLEGKRMRDRKQFGGEGITWASTVGQLCCYDKVQEMKENRHDITPFKGMNIARFELRALKHKKIEQVFGWQTLFDLASDYDSAQAIYRKEMREGIFKYDVDDLEVLSQKQIETELEHFKRCGGRRWLQAYVSECGMQSILRRTTIQNFGRAVEAVTGDKVKAWRHKQNLHRSMVRQKFLTKSENAFKRYGQLYEELRTGVLALKVAA